MRSAESRISGRAIQCRAQRHILLQGVSPLAEAPRLSSESETGRKLQWTAQGQALLQGAGILAEALRLSAESEAGQCTGSKLRCTAQGQARLQGMLTSAEGSLNLSLRAGTRIGPCSARKLLFTAQGHARLQIMGILAEARAHGRASMTQCHSSRGDSERRAHPGTAAFTNAQDSRTMQTLLRVQIVPPCHISFCSLCLRINTSKQ